MIPYKAGDKIQVEPRGKVGEWVNAVVGWANQKTGLISFQYKSGDFIDLFNAEQNYDALNIKPGWGKTSKRSKSSEGNYKGHGQY